MTARTQSAALVLVLMTSAIGACGSNVSIDGSADDRTTSSATSAVADNASAIDWRACGDQRCGTLDVPLDHFDPDSEMIEIALAMRPADDSDSRAGAILLNPGGPGAPGLSMVESLESMFPDNVLENFDLVAWDPRGTGESTSVHCTDDLDDFFATDKSPDTPTEERDNVEAAKAFAAACAEEHGDLLPYLATTQTVEDMDAIRAALGDEGLTYLGFSYGTYLGARYAETHPDRVRALVLDGPVDPSLDSRTSTIQQSIGFERAIDAFFGWCEGNDDCAFTPSDPRRAFERLMAQIDAEELYAEVNGDERGLGPGEADLGVAVALYSGESAYEYLADALAQAAQGDGSTLLEMADLYSGRRPDGSYDGSMAAFFAIGCSDTPRATLDEVRDLAEQLESDAPFLGPAGVWLGLPCTYWPVPFDAAAEPHRIEVPPDTAILVTATDGDPATPIEWARGLAEQLPAPLLVADSDQHTAFTAGDSCVTEAIIDFLVDPDRPVDEC
jgi:pimeloyl-ACP methyl ester carboxylesterase